MGRVTSPDSAPDPEEVERLLADIRREARYAGSDAGRSTITDSTLAAIAAVPRHRFVPEYLRDEAYSNHPLPIGHGQTISQPYIVALMTDLLEVDTAATVMEVGTGCGYQTAVLAELVRRVFTIELVPPLAAEALARLRVLGYDNVEGRTGDGYAGWPEHAPYDGIIVTAAAAGIPPALIDQLKPNARLVIPVSEGGGYQTLTVVTRTAGEPKVESIMPVAFVPLVHASP